MNIVLLIWERQMQWSALLVVLLTSEVKAMTVLSYMPVFLSVLTMLAIASSVAVIMAEIIGISI